MNFLLGDSRPCRIVHFLAVKRSYSHRHGSRTFARSSKRIPAGCAPWCCCELQMLALTSVRPEQLTKAACCRASRTTVRHGRMFANLPRFKPAVLCVSFSGACPSQLTQRPPVIPGDMDNDALVHPDMFIQHTCEAAARAKEGGVGSASSLTAQFWEPWGWTNWPMQ